MLIVTIRTDNPEAEVGVYEDAKRLAYKTWHAHRELSTTLQATLQQVLHDHQKDLEDVGAVICFQGPGSFTGLRIGLTVANAMAYGLDIPIVSTQGDDWIAKGIDRLQSGEDDRIALPYYGAPVHITTQRK